MYEIKVGLDPEFMARYKGNYFYPILDCGDSKFFDNEEACRASYRLGADEFGHCVEIRPDAGTTGKEVVLNTIGAMAELPGMFNYYGENTHQMDKKEFIRIIRTLSRKDISESSNIYDIDILDDCPMDIAARQKGKRLLFCGCHMHISATETIRVPVDKGHKNVTRPRDLPVKFLVSLFDNILFEALDSDKHFDVGRYRQRGFYEMKGHGGFEYRSLGASALTPTRIRLITDIMILLTKEALRTMEELLFLATQHQLTVDVLKVPKEVVEMTLALARTKPCTSDLRKLWVPFD